VNRGRGVIGIDTKVQVINLERAVERRRRMTDLLTERGVPFEFFPAMSGTSAPEESRRTYDRAERIRRFGYDLSDAEIGCALSHQACVRRAYEAGWSHVVVMEDDVTLADDFAEVLTRVLDLDERYELVRLWGGRKRPTRFRARLTAGRTLERLLGPSSGTVCHVLNRRGMEKFLRAQERVVMQVDVAMDRYWENGLETFAVRPYPVGLADVPSQIGTERDDTPWRRDRNWSLRARLKVGKWLDRIRRELHNLRTWFADRADDRRNA